jgi:glutathione S-transferase
MTSESCVICKEPGDLLRTNRYLCDTYDKQHRLLPPLGDPKRYEILRWVHAAEGTFLTHGLAILYIRWFQKEGDVSMTEEGASGNVVKDLNYLEAELNKSRGKLLFGDEPTAADVMMEFTVDFILARQLGTKGKQWPRVEQYLEDCHKTETWQKAVKKTGHKL